MLTCVPPFLSQDLVSHILKNIIKAFLATFIGIPFLKIASGKTELNLVGKKHWVSYIPKKYVVALFNSGQPGCSLKFSWLIFWWRLRNIPIPKQRFVSDQQRRRVNIQEKKQIITWKHTQNYLYIFIE